MASGPSIVHEYTATGHLTIHAAGIKVLPGQKRNVAPGTPEDKMLRSLVGRGFTGPVVVPMRGPAADEAMHRRDADVDRLQEALAGSRRELSIERSRWEGEAQAAERALKDADLMIGELRQKVARQVSEGSDARARVAELEAENAHLLADLETARERERRLRDEVEMLRGQEAPADAEATPEPDSKPKTSTKRGKRGKASK
ncbi:MAG: hypothetical protein ABIL09_00370 [Gemmatimonadota bacterium]